MLIVSLIKSRKTPSPMQIETANPGHSLEIANWDVSIKPKKMLCGKEDKLRVDDGELVTRSLMIAELTIEESMLLQQQGLGTHRLMGCGIFLPHKDISEIGETMG